MSFHILIVLIHAIMHVADPPRITIHPKDSKDAVSGISVNFTVQATGTEPLNYNWEWNPVKEEGIGKWLLCSGMEGSDTATLTISSVQKSNEGSYRCVISNCAGNQTCKAAKLEVEHQGKLDESLNPQDINPTKTTITGFYHKLIMLP